MTKFQPDARSSAAVSEAPTDPNVGDHAPDFPIEWTFGKVTLSELAERIGKVILISYDSYQYHGR